MISQLIFFNNIFYYLSPLVALLILLLVITYLNLKIKKIKILPKDYLKLYHLEKKIRINWQVSNFYNWIIEFFINLLIKLFQISKIHFLRWQLWAEKNINQLKNIKEEKTDNSLIQEDKSLTEDKIS
ncbi:MAG: hypothetical protein KatS3mg094_439 [Candidatus Parcubacteria bacterium]|nr:MAG: hypothetical protein KatS3mg094_439 [Candidatus Parcubacteria bacterium]